MISGAWQEAELRGGGAVPTNIVFMDGRELAVAEKVEDVIAATHGHAGPAAMESTIGARVFVNWDHVAYVAEIPPAGPALSR